MVLSITGHRPKKLKLIRIDEFDLLYEFALSKLKTIISKTDTLLCGMQSGWDLACGVAGITIGCQLKSVLPYPDFKPYEVKPSRYWLKAFDAVRLKSVAVISVSQEPGYKVFKLFKRNEFLVDNSDRVLALWNGSTSGTSHCIEYAKLYNKPVQNVYLDWVDYVENLKHKDDILNEQEREKL